MSPTWTPVLALDALTPGSSRLIRAGEHRVALFRTADGAVHAVDNACPHEGYPLSQGTVKDCVLTCTWHNYKFDLRDGSALVGEEAVRRYPSRVVDGMLELDLTDPDPREKVPGLYQSLAEAVADRRMGQACRDTARLLALGEDPRRLLGWIAADDGRRGEYGSTHALAVSADLLRYLDRYPGPQALWPLAQALELVADSHARRPARPAAPAVDPGADPLAAGARFRAAVEAEEGALAEGLLRGALAKGWGRGAVEPWLLAVAADHFLDFGHALIYVGKACDLLDAAGWDLAPDVLGGLVVMIVYGTREDLLPEWAGFRARFDRAEAPAALAEGDRPPADWDEAAWRAAVLDGKPAAAFAATDAALRAGVPLAALADRLTLAAAERNLRFEVAYDGDHTLSNGWLDVTHLLTFAEALGRAPATGAVAWRLALMGAHFVNHAAALDAKEPREPVPSAGGVEAVIAALRERRAEHAVDAAAGLDRAGLEALALALDDLPLHDVATRPIVVAHLIKTAGAAFAAWRRLGDHPRAVWPVLAAVRLFASPVQERFLARNVHNALAFVLEGAVPRALT